MLLCSEYKMYTVECTFMLKDINENGGNRIVIINIFFIFYVKSEKFNFGWIEVVNKFFFWVFSGKIILG